MSTIAILRSRGVLAAWDIPGSEQAQRCLFYTRAWEEFVNALPKGTAQRNRQKRRAALGPDVRVWADGFVAGRPRTFLAEKGRDPPMKPLWPKTKRVWELRIADTRSFGWFAGPNVYVAVHARRKAELRGGGYRDAADAVVRWREQHGIVAGEIADGSDWTQLVTG